MKLVRPLNKFPQELQFNLLCAMFGHAWYQNKCTRCGETR